MINEQLFSGLCELRGFQKLVEIERAKHTGIVRPGSDLDKYCQKAAAKALELQPAAKAFMESNGTYVKNREIRATRNPNHLEKLLDELEDVLTKNNGCKYHIVRNDSEVIWCWESEAIDKINMGWELYAITDTEEKADKIAELAAE